MSSTTGVWPPPNLASPPVKPPDTHSLGEHAERVSEASLQPYFAKLSEQPDASLALNVHLPFCPSRCLSCDRIAVVQHQPNELEHYVANLALELARTASLLGERRTLSRVHFGGGSPNHLSELALATVFSHISEHFGVDDSTQFSMELNPRRTSRAQLNFLKGLGIEHIKLEVRDVDANVQREIGRIHSLELLEDVISIAHGVNFDSIGMDYLIGLPGQTMDSCEQSMEAILSLAPDWLVCLPFHRRESLFPHQIAVHSEHLPSLADRMVMFNQVQMDFTEAGYEWVGLNVFAKPDHPLAVAQREGTLALNVLGYGVADLAVVGIGLGALGELPGIVTQNETRLSAWHNQVETGVLSVASAIRADDSETLERMVMRNLMCRQSISVDSLTESQREKWILPLTGQGYAEEVAGLYRLTELGLTVLPHVWTDSSPAFRAF
jgi:oxygen-independent coproporphyrinogen-3 oxidase